MTRFIVDLQHDGLTIPTAPATHHLDADAARGIHGGDGGDQQSQAGEGRRSQSAQRP